MKWHGAAAEQEGPGAAAEDAHDQAQPAAVRRRRESGEGALHRRGNPDRGAGMAHAADKRVGHGNKHGRSAVAGGCRRRRLDGGRHTCYPPAVVISESIIISRRTSATAKMDVMCYSNDARTPLPPIRGGCTDYEPVLRAGDGNPLLAYSAPS